MSSTADVANLEKQRLTEALFDIQVVVVVVGVSEVLADGKNIIDLSAAIAGGAQASGRGKDGVVRDDGAAAGYRRHSVHRTGASRITFQAVGGTVSGTVIKKGVQIRSVEINAESCANDEVATFPGLIGEAQPGSEIFEVFRINAGDASALEDQSAFAGDKNGEIFLVVAEGAFIIPTDTVIDGEFMVDLPGILRKQSKSFYEDQAGGIA